MIQRLVKGREEAHSREGEEGVEGVGIAGEGGGGARVDSWTHR